MLRRAAQRFGGSGRVSVGLMGGGHPCLGGAALPVGDVLWGCSLPPEPLNQKPPGGNYLVTVQKTRGPLKSEDGLL